MSTIQQINSTIISGAFTNEQLDSIATAIKFARNQLATQAKFTLVKGTRVKFTNSRTGQLMIGDVTDVKRKFIHVRVGMSNWRVPANMLSAA